MTSRKTAAAIALVASFTPACFPPTSDFLRPEHRFHSDFYAATYQLALTRLLLPRTASFDVLVVPSFQPEEAVSLDWLPEEPIGSRAAGRERECHVRSARMRTSLWSQWTPAVEAALVPSQAHDAEGVALRRQLEGQVDRASAILPGPACLAAWSAWLEALSQIRSPRVAPSSDAIEIRVDGTVHHFSMLVKGVELSGQTWSPEPGTRQAALIELAERVGSYARAPEDRRPALAGAIEKEGAALVAWLRVTRRRD